MIRIKNKVDILKAIIVFLIFGVFILSMIIIINRSQIRPNENEVLALEAFFGKKSINVEQDIIYIQNKVVNEVLHKSTGSGQLDILNTLKLKKGLCFDRSLVLQKYLILKGYKIRPVYLFWGKNSTSIFDLVKSNTQSHNVFEIYFNKNWYLIRTNRKMERLELLSHYLTSGKMVPTHTRYVRYLNNRNGNFIYPSYIPDIYFF
jgi:hypothetical protein